MMATLRILCVLWLLARSVNANCDSTGPDFLEELELVRESTAEDYRLNLYRIRTVLEKINCIDRKVALLIREVNDIQMSMSTK